MKIAVVDISGKVIKYDISLCENIQSCGNGSIKVDYYAPLYDESPRCKTTKLLNLVPKKYKNGEYLWKRVIKVVELCLNYIYLICKVACQRPEVVHFQWFPLLEFCGGEHLVVRLMRFLSRKTKMVLTIHNVYPHTFSEGQKKAYRERFFTIDCLIDAYIVHTQETKEEVAREFNIPDNRIYVVHHGIFTPDNFKPKDNLFDEKDLKFIMYGNLSDYKGVDVFVEAIKELPESYQKRVHGVIAGEMQNKVLCKKLQDESRGLNIDWYPYFLPDYELYERINEANVIVLPYKHISQSGVLLLALFFRRYIITSDLLPFKETLHGFSEDMFFESENPKSLAQLMMRFVDGKVDTEKQMNVIEGLNEQYSWSSAAEKTIQLYKML